MPTNICTPLFKGGNPDETVRVTADVLGKTFGRISADIQSGPALTTVALGTYDGGNLQAATCGLGQQPDGVFAYDQLSGGVVPFLKPDSTLPLTAGAGITAGQEVMCDAAGKPIPAVGASATLELGTGNSKIKFTATDPGNAGNGISVRLKDPAANTQTLSVTVTGNDVVVNLATDGAGAITSTVTLIIAAIAASAAAASLVVASNGTGSSGAGVVVAAGPSNLTGGSNADEAAVGKATTTALTGADCFVRFY